VQADGPGSKTFRRGDGTFRVKTESSMREEEEMREVDAHLAKTHRGGNEKGAAPRVRRVTSEKTLAPGTAPRRRPSVAGQLAASFRMAASNLAGR